MLTVGLHEMMPVFLGLFRDPGGLGSQVVIYDEVVLGVALILNVKDGVLNADVTLHVLGYYIKLNMSCINTVSVVTDGCVAEVTHAII